MLSSLQKSAAQAIVNIFETSRARGDYGKVTLLPGDSGHLTYGRAQTTLASGNLHTLIRSYCEAAEVALAEELRIFLKPLQDRDLSLNHDQEFRNLLREAGDDPVMRATQDAFFDRVYWEPATRSAAHIDARSALGHAIVYDSRVHGSWHRIRDRTNAERGTTATLGEEAWLQAYIEVRRDWLANHPRSILRKTVYRMDAFSDLFSENRWDLDLPFVVRGVRIDETVLTSPMPVRASAEEPADRVLSLRRPFMRGEDVRRVQQALKAAGLDVAVDGVFGPATEIAVTSFQSRQGLTIDGIVGPATLAALDID